MSWRRDEIVYLKCIVKVAHSSNWGERVDLFALKATVIVNICMLLSIGFCYVTIVNILVNKVWTL